MDHQELATIGRRAALMALAGSTLLATSGCHAINAIIARLSGDSSYDDEGGTGDPNADPHLSRNDRRQAPSSDSAASATDDPSDGLPPDDGTIPE